MHNENWSVGDEATSLLAILQTDHAQGKMKEWDVVNLIQQLCMSKIYFYLFKNKICFSRSRYNSLGDVRNNDQPRTFP